MKDPALLKPPKEGEGWAHGTLFQARALLPPIISSCKASSTHQPPTEITDPQLSPTALIQDEAGPLPHHTHPIPPGHPTFVPRWRGGRLLLGELWEQVGGWPGGHGPHPWAACRAREERGRDLKGPQASSVCLISASLRLQAASAVSASLSLSLSLRLLFPPRPEHTWLLTSDNPTTAARPASSSPSLPPALFLPRLLHLVAP